MMNPPDIEKPTHKVCYRCHESKELQDFNKCRTGIYGYHNHCRLCQKTIRLEWYRKNKDWVLNDYSKSPEVKKRASDNQKKRYWSDPIKREAQLALNRELRKKESAKVKARIQRTKWRSIPHNKIATTLRARLRCALKDIAKAASTEKLLGCSFEFLKEYLTELFKEGMTWDNYGEWHIDHIKPCAVFNLTDEDEQRKCFNYKNLQPLWKLENIAKGCKY